jgi:hypothetical protein
MIITNINEIEPRHAKNCVISRWRHTYFEIIVNGMDIIIIAIKTITVIKYNSDAKPIPQNFLRN